VLVLVEVVVASVPSTVEPPAVIVLVAAPPEPLEVEVAVEGPDGDASFIGIVSS
jgi:hypothetical protein